MNNGMDNGLTGIDPSEAIDDIWDFGEKWFSAYDSLLMCFDFLFEELHYIWCSHNAVAFSQKYNIQIGDFHVNTYEKFSSLEDNLIRAYNIVANANGYENFSISPNGDHPKYFSFAGTDRDPIIHRGKESFKSLVSSHPTNGTVGMNINRVKLVMSQFDSKAKEVLANFESIPTNVAIYDPNGEMQQTIADAINVTKMSIASFLESIITDIKAYIEIEENSIMLAKQQVVQNMNGSSTTNA